MASLQQLAPLATHPLFAADHDPLEAELPPDPLPAVRSEEDLATAADASPPSTWDLPAEHLPLEQDFRHQWWAKRRARTYDALNAAGVSARRLINFQHCGAMAMVEVQDKTGQVRVTACKCHDRMCQSCGEERGRMIASNLEAKCRQAKTLHVVLTLISTDDGLDACLDRIFKCFAKLRKHPWWQLHVDGGAYTFECTWNPDTQQWHPHLHVLVHADYLDQRTLRQTWHQVTGDSHVANVSLVGSTIAAAREVTKYLGKPIHRSVDGNQALTVELLTALHGRHLVTTFGSWRGSPVTAYPIDPFASKWQPVCTLIELHRRAATGDIWSIETLRYLHSHRPGRQHVPPSTHPHPTPSTGAQHDPAP